jgi:hypothetical protein
MHLMRSNPCTKITCRGLCASDAILSPCSRFDVFQRRVHSKMQRLVILRQDDPIAETSNPAIQQSSELLQSSPEATCRSDVALPLPLSLRNVEDLLARRGIFHLN